jgi:hypothetical protein
MQGYGWTSEDNRDMHADGVKTTITAAGAAVALVASNSSAGRAPIQIVALSAKLAARSLVSCAG